MRLLRAEVTHAASESDRSDAIDFVVHANLKADVTAPGNVRTNCTETRCEGMPPVMTSPTSLKDQIRSSVRPGVRAMVGNAGCELTFRHIVARPRKNVRQMLRWADAAYELLGIQLVLAPMDYDLIHDVMQGGPLLAWAAEHRVPLAVFCGYRFLFPEDAFPHIQHVCRQHPMKQFANPFDYPYSEVSDAVRQSGAEVWTGAGFTEGLAAGTLEKAERFGFASVFTSREGWNGWRSQLLNDDCRGEIRQ